MKHGQRNKEEMPSSTSWVSSSAQAHANSDFISLQQAQFLSRQGWQYYMKWPNSMLLCSNINIKVLSWFPDSFSQQRRVLKAVLTSTSWLVSPAHHMSVNMFCQSAPAPLHSRLQHGRDRRQLYACSNCSQEAQGRMKGRKTWSAVFV